MLKQSSRLTLAVALVAATTLIAGGVAIASNTGFKINKPLTVAGAGQIGNNWLSIPYFSPYTNGAELCAQLDFSIGAVKASLLKINAVNGAASTASCGTPAAGAFTWNPGDGIRVRNAGDGGDPAPTSAIIVGSHNPSTSLSIPDAGGGNIGNFWFAVPYHTTAVTAQDLCNSVGMTSVPIPPPGSGSRGQVGRLNSVSGAFTTVSCGTDAALALTLVLGEAVRLREPEGPISFVPAHF